MNGHFVEAGLEHKRFTPPTPIADPLEVAKRAAADPESPPAPSVPL